jgi:hypothetical protein
MFPPVLTDISIQRFVIFYRVLASFIANISIVLKKVQSNICYINVGITWQQKLKFSSFIE